MDRYYPTSRIVRLTRAKEKLDTAIHEITGEEKLSILDVIVLLHEAERPRLAAAEGQQAEWRRYGEEE